MGIPYYAYGAVGLTGGNDSNLDNITTEALNQNDIAIALEDNKIYFYRIEEDSGETEDSPYIIQPDDETGDKRWILISQEMYNSNIIQLLEYFIQTSHIKAIEDNDLEIESSDGSKVVIKKDGVIEFPSYAKSSEDPTEDDHLTNKKYVDDEYDSKETELKDYVDDEYDSKETELKDYVDEQVETKGTIVRTTIDSWESSDDLYYKDITHDKGYIHIIVRCWQNDEIIYPEKIESIDENNTRIYMPNDDTLYVVLM